MIFGNVYFNKLPRVFSPYLCLLFLGVLGGIPYYYTTHKKTLKLNLFVIMEALESSSH